MSIYPEAAATRRRLSLLHVVVSVVMAGAATALVVLAFSPFSAATAAFSAPLYAVVAGGYSVFPFLARRVLGFRWAATAAGTVAGLLSAPISPIGLLIVVPFVAGGAAYDATIWALARFRRDGRTPECVFAAAAAVSALVLFLVSMPVMTNRAPLFLLAVLGGRLAGQSAASALAGLAARVASRRGSAGRPGSLR
ncbi:hypothetical protein [Leifsonia sp. C5G2]|uniref:hypothetical protein n=1 Tax=Leifsonia sp. C5G2 TaxID=2735269 RepID=UPI00201C09E0|nr:hypothetical protein [Leifsonia sp. C5G2]